MYFYGFALYFPHMHDLGCSSGKGRWNHITHKGCHHGEGKQFAQQTGAMGVKFLAQENSIKPGTTGV